MEQVRTRFAPSPTGFMHVGNLRSALFEYLVAKSLSGKFILRIEDTDQVRKVEGAIDFLYDTLKLCGFNIDEGPREGGEFGPYTQSDRLALYKEYAHKLVETGEAYYCFCSSERIASLREEAEINKIPFMYDKTCAKLSEEDIKEKLDAGLPYVIRQNINKDIDGSYTDLVYGEIKVDSNLIEDQILLKSDGYPTYNFANVIDDYLMNITHVVRGNEYLSSTPKYNLLYKALGFKTPQYIHLPHVNGSDGKKLSKRNGDASFMDLYNDGYLPEAIINYLALLGWSPKDNQEIFTMEQLIKHFDISRINRSGAIFDIKKLRWVNAHYLKQLSDESIINLCLPFLKDSYPDIDLTKANRIILLYKKEINYGKEIIELSKLFFKKEFNVEPELLPIIQTDLAIKVIAALRDEITNSEELTPETAANIINKVKELTGAKGKDLYMTIRIAVSGQEHGPELPEVISLLGKETILNRI